MMLSKSKFSKRVFELNEKGTSKLRQFNRLNMVIMDRWCLTPVLHSLYSKKL